MTKTIKERAKLASENYACDDRYSAGFFTGYVEGAIIQLFDIPIEIK